LPSSFALCAACLVIVTDAHAAADGPDFWDVSGVAAGDVLHLRSGQSARAGLVAKIPHDAKGLRNLGCQGGPSFSAWTRMTAAQRASAARRRWCKVEYAGKRGWVAGRFLAEAGPPAPGQAATPPAKIVKGSAARIAAASFGAWTVRCAPECHLEQLGQGGARPAVLTIEPAEGVNARFTIVRGSLPASGKLEIWMDGTLITAGPLEQLLSKDGSRILFEPDDITLGLLRRIKDGQTMVVSFPGEDRGIEFRLGGYAAAWQKATGRGAP
jgi:hypothetical protein